MSSLVYISYLFYFCKTQTIIQNGEWLDDFTGWSDTKSFTKACGPAPKYHGAWLNMRSYTLEQTFTCDNGVTDQRYWVSIAYGIAYDPCDDPNTLNVQINSQTVATHTRLDGTTPALYQSADCFSPSIGCGNHNPVWVAHIQEGRSITPSLLNDITSNDPFTLTFAITIGEQGHELAIFDIVVTCNAKTTLTTISPTDIPSTYSTTPTSYPTSQPTNTPTLQPTATPTTDPTNIPTYMPTLVPTVVPTLIPIATNKPSTIPTTMPTSEPTNEPTTIPTYIPTYIPTNDPTNNPTNDPTNDPTYDPTIIPTNFPTASPTRGRGGESGVTEQSIAIQGTRDEIRKETIWSRYPIEVYYVMILIIILLIICIFLLLILCCIAKRKRKQNIIAKNIELARITSTSMSMDGLNLDNYNNTNASGFTNKIMSSSSASSGIPGVAAHAVNSEPDVYSDHVALQMWLKNVDCMEYYDTFIEQGFGDHMATLSTITDSDLQAMGVNKLAVRKKILLQVQSMNVNMGLVPEGPSVQFVNGTGTHYDVIDYNTNNIVMDNEYSESDDEENDLYLTNVNAQITKGGVTLTPGSKGDVDDAFIEDGGSESEQADDKINDKLYQKADQQTIQ